MRTPDAILPPPELPPRSPAGAAHEAKPADAGTPTPTPGEYHPSPDLAPPQTLPRGQVTTSRTAFSARTMTALTSETGRSRGRRVPTMRVVAQVLVLLDLCALVLVAAGAAALPSLFPTAWMAPIGALLPLGGLLLGTLGLIDAHRIELRESSWHLHGRILGALALATALALGAAYAEGLWRPPTLGLALRDRTLVIAVGFTLLAMVNRSLLRRWLHAASGQANWLLVARRDTEGLDQFWADFIRHRTHGRLMLFTDGPETAAHHHQPDRWPPTAGKWQDLKSAYANACSGIIVVDAALLDPDTVRTVMEARLSGTPVLSLEEFYELYWRRVPVFLLRSEWFAISRGFEILRSPVQSHLKRACDMLLAGGLLLLATPLMAVIAIGVKLGSPGPILYRQPRTGRGGRVFTCLKFRSMVTNADRGPLYASKNDSRVTPFGRFIRRARIDELPQLINVLTGDMSFIGPRAMWTQIVAGHDQEIPYFQLRHLVRPGLTGWAQVNYHYGGSAEDMRIKLEYDLWYIKHQSLFLDLWIVLRTVRVVLFGIGAQ